LEQPGARISQAATFPGQLADIGTRFASGWLGNFGARNFVGGGAGTGGGTATKKLTRGGEARARGRGGPGGGVFSGAAPTAAAGKMVGWGDFGRGRRGAM